MTLTEIIISVLVLGSIFGGILLLKQSAKKFNLTPEQLAEIKKRNEALDKEDKNDQWLITIKSFDKMKAKFCFNWPVNF